MARFPFGDNGASADSTVSRSSPFERPRTGFLGAGLAVLLMLLGGVGAGHALAFSNGGTGPCYDGFQTLQQVDNSFSWQGQGLFPPMASWSGVARLLGRTDTDCRIAEIRVEYNGNPTGGTLVLNGNLFVSFTVQYPTAFTDYANMSSNAYGHLVAWNPPAGVGPGYTVETNMNINDRGADEYVVQGMGAAATVSGVALSFRVPLSLLGQTVYAQIHVGNDLCQCSVVGLTLPASTFWNVYVHAHEDDWQLFESPNAFEDYQTGDNVLFILATAGDAGNPASYWQARETAAEASAQYIVPAGPSEQDAWVTVCYVTTETVCHDIFTRAYGRTISVFMRAPDGGNQGGGFPSTNYETLEKLRDGVIDNVTTVDGSTTYHGWADFYLTIKAVIDAYAPSDSTTWVNAPDFDRDLQTTHAPLCDPCPDHADHLAVADAIYAITTGTAAPWSRAWFIDYPIAWADPRYPANLGPLAYTVKKGAYMAYNDAMKRLIGLDEYAQMPSFYENAFNRDYYRFA